MGNAFTTQHHTEEKTPMISPDDIHIIVLNAIRDDPSAIEILEELIADGTLLAPC